MNSKKLSNTKDYSIHEINSNMGDVIDTHHHDNWDESWYILEGEFEITIANKTLNIKKGDFITAYRNVPHKVTTLADNSKRLAIFNTLTQEFPSIFSRGVGAVGNKLTKIYQ